MSLLVGLEFAPQLTGVGVKAIMDLVHVDVPPATTDELWTECAFCHFLLDLLMLLVLNLPVTLSPELEEILEPSAQALGAGVDLWMQHILLHLLLADFLSSAFQLKLFQKEVRRVSLTDGLQVGREIRGDRIHEGYT